ncbi:COP1-interactive protein 1-like [Cucurbita pepo subsp. pepo]|uniref:COP1-interactive protein 1-like n=1 Tax=Cucurbita pepo subsp. pepo TaxID=3664 RepID=UPI000C9D956A|nr:COP1-interactive protein 1-like [Cucurbita pepo subsp. pepo]
MSKHRVLKGLTECSGHDSKLDDITEQQKMTKAEMEQKILRILKLMKNKDHGKNRGMSRDSKKETEVIGLVEDLYKNYQSIYEQYGHLRDEAERIVKSRKGKEKDNEDVSSSSSSSSSDSESEYFSSEEISNSCVHSLRDEQSSILHAQIQADELEKQIEQKNEALAKVDSLHWELDSVLNQKREMENRKNQEICENMILIGNLKEELTEKIGVVQKMLDEKERVLARIKDMETEIDTMHYRRREIEDQNIRMRSENQWLSTRNSELELALTSKETEASSQTIALMEQVKNLKQKMDALQAERTKLGQDMEQCKQKFSHKLSEMEAENNKLKIKIIDRESILKEKDKTITALNEKNKQAKSCLPDVASSMIGAERKMEDLAEELRNSLEDKIRLLSQRILVAEQLHNESKENFRARNKRYEQEKRQFEKKIGNHEAELMKLDNMNEFEMDRMTRKIEEESTKLLNHILKITKELTFAKYWVRTRNNELKQLKTNLTRFVAQMEEKEEQEFMLREKVWNLEAKLSKEGGEKLNLIRSLSQLEKKMTKMVNLVKEKDEEVFQLAEEKREVIRQLCAVIDHHRSRYDLLKDAMMKNVRNIKMI